MPTVESTQSETGQLEAIMLVGGPGDLMGEEWHSRGREPPADHRYP
jgi:hypothetical protein